MAQLDEDSSPGLARGQVHKLSWGPRHQLVEQEANSPQLLPYFLRVEVRDIALKQQMDVRLLQPNQDAISDQRPEI